MLFFIRKSSHSGGDVENLLGNSQTIPFYRKNDDALSTYVHHTEHLVEPLAREISLNLHWHEFWAKCSDLDLNIIFEVNNKNKRWVILLNVCYGKLSILYTCRLLHILFSFFIWTSDSDVPAVQTPPWLPPRTLQSSWGKWDQPQSVCCTLVPHTLCLPVSLGIRSQSFW